MALEVTGCEEGRQPIDDVAPEAQHFTEPLFRLESFEPLSWWQWIHCSKINACDPKPDPNDAQITKHMSDYWRKQFALILSPSPPPPLEFVCSWNGVCSDDDSIGWCMMVHSEKLAELHKVSYISFGSWDTLSRKRLLRLWLPLTACGFDFRSLLLRSNPEWHLVWSGNLLFGMWTCTELWKTMVLYHCETKMIPNILMMPNLWRSACQCCFPPFLGCYCGWFFLEGIW